MSRSRAAIRSIAGCSWVSHILYDLKHHFSISYCSHHYGATTPSRLPRAFESGDAASGWCRRMRTTGLVVLLAALLNHGQRLVKVRESFNIQSGNARTAESVLT